MLIIFILKAAHIQNNTKYNYYQQSNGKILRSVNYTTNLKDGGEGRVEGGEDLLLCGILVSWVEQRKCYLQAAASYKAASTWEGNESNRLISQLGFSLRCCQAHIHKQGFVAHVYWRIDTFYILIQKSRCSATVFKSWVSKQLLNQCL